MKGKILYFISLNLISLGVFSQSRDTVLLPLKEIIATAQDLSIRVKIATSIKQNKQFQFTSYKSSVKPQLSLIGKGLNYSKDYFGVIQPDGNLIFQPREQNYSNLGLSLSQEIGLTGGTLSVNSGLERFDDFARVQKQYNGIPISASLSQPLFAANLFKWAKQIEPLKFKESEREFFIEKENIALEASQVYFDLLDAQADLELATKNLAEQQLIYEIENKRANIGTTTKDKILQIQLQLLKTTQDLSKARVRVKTCSTNLINFTGIKDVLILRAVFEQSIPNVNVSLGKALQAAKENRPEFLTYKRKKLEAQRDLDVARKQRFSIDVNASIGFNNIGYNLPSVYVNPKAQQALSLTLKVPLIDWGRNSGKVNEAQSNLKTVEYLAEQEGIAFLQQLSDLVTNFELIKLNIDVAKKTDSIAEERYKISLNQFGLGKITITDLNIAFVEKDNARKAFIGSLRAFWETYYKLRAMTLMDL